MGSGVILDKSLIATNCHVALVSEEGPNRIIWLRNVNDKKNGLWQKFIKKIKKKIFVYLNINL